MAIHSLSMSEQLIGAAMEKLDLQRGLLALFALIVAAIFVSKLKSKKLKLPPGPRAVPLFGNWLQVGDDLNQRNLTDLAKKYGDIFLLKMGQRNLLVVASPELAKEVLQTQGVEFGSRPRNVVYDIFTGSGQDMIFTYYGHHWRKMRRIMTAPFFTHNVVQKYRSAWEEEIGRAMEDIRARPEASSEGIVIRGRMQLMVYNIMYRMLFDRRFESEEDPLFLRLKTLNAQRSRMGQSFEYNYGDFIPILSPLLRGYMKICKQVKEKRQALFTESFIKERRQLGITKGDRKCGMDYIFEAQEKGEINEENVLYLIDNMNTAGMETIVWTMEWVIAELVNHPEIQQKIRDELDAVVGPGIPMTEPDIVKLPYLQAVMKESLRLHITLPFVPRLNVPQTKLGGYDIPAGTKVLVNIWWLANNPELWDNPQDFIPERFLQEGEKIEFHGNDFRFLPFGAGRRSCPGIHMALANVALTVGRLLQNFELLPPPGKSKVDVSDKGGQFSLPILNHTLLVAKPRLPASS